jgi:predicted phosphoadenosine phosphosulfate sulfurtransferase
MAAPRMRIYRNLDVLEAARQRIRWIFSEFPNVVCNVSGGKDSTVLWHLALETAQELGRTPLKTFWIDQEAEWQSTVDIIREWMYHPDVEPHWLQVPFKIFNATSTTEHWLHAWDPEREEDWIHPADPIAIRENPYGTDRFHDLFKAFAKYHFPDQPCAFLNGMRAEEAPARSVGLTEQVTYKGETWGRTEDSKRKHYSFAPLYDWSYLDIWKAIHSNGWPYNRHYDAQYRYGIPLPRMRVSNVHHETAVHSLFYMQEVEPETYERLCARIDGIDMAGKMGKDDYFVSDLPPMFQDWREYRDFLLEKLIDNADWRERFEKRFAYHDRDFSALGDMLYRVQVQSILTNDWEGEKMRHFEMLYHGRVGKERIQAIVDRRAELAALQGGKR